MSCAYNKKEAEKAKRRRTMLYRVYIKNDLTILEMARRYRVTYERMRQQIRKAEGEC